MYSTGTASRAIKVGTLMTVSKVRMDKFTSINRKGEDMIKFMYKYKRIDNVKSLGKVNESNNNIEA